MDIKVSPRDTRALDFLTKLANKSSGKIAKTDDPTIFQAKLGEKTVTLKLNDLRQETVTQLGKLKEATEQLEGVLVKQLLETMQKSTPKNQFDGPMGDFAKDMFNQSMGDESGRKGLFGVGQTVFSQLSRPILNQEVARARLAQIKSGDK
ncbi:MAG: hypothetical protein K8R88_01580 [Armatimonadetes bacterium]|nr:hypothetical protein [Armatimonadota bacterium]